MLVLALVPLALAGAQSQGSTQHAGRPAGAAVDSPTVARPSTATSSVHVVSDSFPIPQLGRTRRVWVYLPPDYESSGRRYPVLYMHDGQNVFDAATSFAGEWGVDETLDSLHALGGPGAIVVAVDHGGEHRLDEYDPWKSARPQLGGGEGDEYADFLVHTLKPWVDAHYRTLADAPHTGIMGSSMGGLISLYAALQHPEVFGRAAVFSCACWVARPAIYAYARATAGAGKGTRFYFVAGAAETADSEPARDQREMVDTLRAAGLVIGQSLEARVVPDGKHAEWFWRREFPAAYAWMFNDAPRRRGGRGASRDDCLPLLPARVRLAGSPQLQLVTDAKGGARGGTAADTSIVLALDEPADVCADTNRATRHPATRVSAVQLIGAPRSVLVRLGYSATVYGRLLYRAFDTHHTEVVLYVDSMPVPGIDGRSAARQAPVLTPAGCACDPRAGAAARAGAGAATPASRARPSPGPCTTATRHARGPRWRTGSAACGVADGRSARRTQGDRRSSR